MRHAVIVGRNKYYKSINKLCVGNLSNIYSTAELYNRIDEMIIDRKSLAVHLRREPLGILLKCYMRDSFCISNSN